MAGRGQVIGNKREIQSKLHCHLSEKQTVQNAYKLLICSCLFIIYLYKGQKVLFISEKSSTFAEILETISL